MTVMPAIARGSAPGSQYCTRTQRRLTGIGALVCTRERHRRGRLRTRAALDVQLRALHVELRAGVGRRAVQGCVIRLLSASSSSSYSSSTHRLGRTDDLVAEKVLPALDAARNRKRHLALVCNEPIYGPLTSRHSQAILVDLEPLQTGNGTLSRVWNLRTAKCPVLTLETLAQRLMRKKTHRYEITGPLCEGSMGSAGSPAVWLRTWCH